MSYAELARISLQLIAQAGVKADDKSLETAKAARDMLRGIASGALVVGAPIRDADKGCPEKSDDAV